MTIEQLRRLGFNESLAKAYLMLLEHGKLTPPELAKLVHETRPNAYSLLNKLVSMDLASKHPTAKKATYRAEDPVALEKLMQNQRNEALERERLATAAVPELTNLYKLSNEQPGVRFYQGKKGIEEIYRQQIREGQPIYFLQSRAPLKFFGLPFMRALRLLAPKAGIARRVISPDAPEVQLNYKQTDKKRLITRIWYDQKDYTAPVEWSVYGDKVSAVSFGKEVIGLVIDSPQIAESIRQIFRLVEDGLRTRPNYHELPRLADYTNAEDFLRRYPEYRAK